MYNKDYLAHYGVKGMKWGVRHDKPSSGEIRKRVKKNAKTYAALVSPIGPAYAAKKAHRASEKAKEKRYNNSDYAKAKKMSDQELRDRINRINLEQSYVQAMQRDKQAYKDATQSVLTKHGKAAFKYSNSIVNNKKFKEHVAKKTAKALL